MTHFLYCHKLALFSKNAEGNFLFSPCGQRSNDNEKSKHSSPKHALIRPLNKKEKKKKATAILRRIAL